jgi:hypothetical protein
MSNSAMNKIRTWIEAIWRWLTNSDDRVFSHQDPPTPRAPRRKRTRRATGLRELLASLAETFELYRLPYSRMSWVTKAETVGLRKLGVHVVSDPEGIMVEGLQTVTTGILSSLMCVGYGLSRFDTTDEECEKTKIDGKVYPAFCFAIKQSKLPSTVSPCGPGQHFLFGSAYRSGRRSASDREKDLTWLSCYITVSSSGELHVHREHKSRSITIPCKNGRPEIYSRMDWETASYAGMYEAERHSDGVAYIKWMFANAVKWWSERDQEWSVSVKKNGERVTFAVPKKETKHFFKDRIKVTTPSGATKKIVHYVRPHDREIESGRVVGIREHIRGLFVFDWNGYKCEVTAPNFNGQLNTSFVAPSISDEDAVPMEKTVDISKAGSILAEAETPRRRQKRGRG